ncbi:MAG: hypothetical protein ACU84Q_01790 [Gammaproteobacteria bacterium]
MRKNGKTSAKVFKWKTIDIEPDETIKLKKKQSFNKTTVRELYPGVHRVELQFNGERVTQANLELLAQ